MSTLKLDTLSNKAGTASVPSDTIVSGTAKAWVNFNGTGTVAIRRAFNVSSITDNGTGDYTVNFTTAMSDANYAAVASIGNDDVSIGTPTSARQGSNSNTSYRYSSCYANSGTTGLYDYAFQMVAIFS